MEAKQRKIFESYFQLRVEREDAFSTGDKLALVRKMYQEAAEDGAVPIAANRVAQSAHGYPAGAGDPGREGSGHRGRTNPGCADLPATPGEYVDPHEIGATWYSCLSCR